MDTENERRSECVTQAFCKLVHAAHDEKFDGLKDEVREMKTEIKTELSRLSGILIGNGKPGHGQRITIAENEIRSIRESKKDNIGLGKFAAVMFLMMIIALGCGAIFATFI